MFKLPKNFFVQPCDGFNALNQGLTSAQLDQYEQKIGFALPQSYRQLMQIQNGCAVRYSNIAGTDAFDFACGFHPIRLDIDYYLYVFTDYILATCDEDELAEIRQTDAPFYPERLIIFCGLDGHSTLCFDYGYKQHLPVAEPAVVYMSDDGDDFLHFGELAPKFANFDAFLHSLSYVQEDHIAAFIGINSALSYAQTTELLAQQFNLTLKIYENDNRYGHYNFDVWHSTHLPLTLDDITLQQYAIDNNISLQAALDYADENGRTRNIYAIISPNQHRAGTYLFADNPEINVVIELHKPWFNPENTVANLCKKIERLAGINSVMLLP